MQTVIYEINDKNIELAKNILLSGGVVGIPTETVYGLGAVGTMPNAVKQIFEVKGRPTDNPLIAHVHSKYDIEKLVYIDNEYVKDLMKAFMPGPLTLVFRSKGVVCKEAVCNGDTLAIRMPSHKGCQQLLSAVNQPIVAPSANLSKHTSPTTAQYVFNDLNGKIPLILDGGKCSGGIESTVLDVTSSVPRILRAGLITKEMIEKIVGKCEIAQHKEGDKVKSPGVKYRHYHPKCETALFEYGQFEELENFYNEQINLGKKAYILCSEEVALKFPNKNILNLGKTDKEIAFNLYDKLLQGENIADIIIAMSMPKENGIYLGIMNRLRKACK